MQRRIQVTYRRCFSAITLGIALLAAAAGGAQAELDPVDASVEAFVVGGHFIGISVGPEEKEFLKPLLRCAVDNQNKKVVDCAKEAAVAYVPEEGRDFVLCMIEGKALPECAARGAISQLPEKTRDYAKCLLDPAQVTGCAAKASASNLSGEDRKLAECLGRERDPAKCGRSFVASKAQQGAVDGFAKVHGDPNASGAAVQGPIKNIIDVAIGIKTDDWQKVFDSGGGAVTKAAGRIVLAVFLTPFGASVLGPAVDVAVDNRFNLAAGILTAVKKRDAGLIARYIIEAQIGYSTAVACAVIQDDGLPTGDLKNAVCNALGSAISTIAAAGMKGINTILDLLGLQGAVNDVFGLLNDSVYHVRQVADGKRFDCINPDKFYQQNFARCYSKQAYENVRGNGEAFLTGRNRKCRDYYFRCFFTPEVNKICNPMFDRYAADTQDMTRAVGAAVDGFLKKQPVLRCTPMNTLEPIIEERQLGCTSSVRGLVPATGFVDTADCGPHPQPTFGGPADPLYTHACKVPLDRQKEFLGSPNECIIATIEIPPCPAGMSYDRSRMMCACPGKGMWDGARCRQVGLEISPCQKTMSFNLLTRKCECPHGNIWDGTRCKFVKAAFGTGKGKGVSVVDAIKQGGGISAVATTKVPRCTGARPFGVWPNCCPRRAPRFASERCWRYRTFLKPKATPGGAVVLTTPQTGGGQGNVSVRRWRVCGNGKVVRRGRPCPVGTIAPQVSGGGGGGGSVNRGGGGTGGGTATGCPPSRPVGKPPYCCRRGYSCQRR